MILVVMRLGARGRDTVGLWDGITDGSVGDKRKLVSQPAPDALGHDIVLMSIRLRSSDHFQLYYSRKGSWKKVLRVQ